jgi:putative effector of murein hydrolase
MNYALTALFTTLLSVIVYMVISRLSTRVRKPNAPTYAVTR